MIIHAVPIYAVFGDKTEKQVDWRYRRVLAFDDDGCAWLVVSEPCSIGGKFFGGDMRLSQAESYSDFLGLSDKPPRSQSSGVAIPAAAGWVAVEGSVFPEEEPCFEVRAHSVAAWRASEYGALAPIFDLGDGEIGVFDEETTNATIIGVYGPGMLPSMDELIATAKRNFKLGGLYAKHATKHATPDVTQPTVTDQSDGRTE